GLGVVRGIVARGDAEGEVGYERPARLREDAVTFAADVAVDVENAGHDRLAARVDPLRASRDRHGSRRTDRGNAVAFDHDRRVFDDALIWGRTVSFSYCAGGPTPTRCAISRNWERALDGVLRPWRACGNNAGTHEGD